MKKLVSLSTLFLTFSSFAMNCNVHVYEGNQKVQEVKFEVTSAETPVEDENLQVHEAEFELTPDATSVEDENQQLHEAEFEITPDATSDEQDFRGSTSVQVNGQEFIVSYARYTEERGVVSILWISDSSSKLYAEAFASGHPENLNVIGVFGNNYAISSNCSK